MGSNPTSIVTRSAKFVSHICNIGFKDRSLDRNEAFHGEDPRRKHAVIGEKESGVSIARAGNTCLGVCKEGLAERRALPGSRFRGDDRARF